MSDETDRIVDVHTIRGSRNRDGRLESVALTVELSGPNLDVRARLHYGVTDGTARLDHFVVDDDLSVFAVADLACVPVAERAITVVPGVESVEPAIETFERVLDRGQRHEEAP